jgi:hypothetical protein
MIDCSLWQMPMIKRISGNPTIVCLFLLLSVTVFWYFAIERHGQNLGKAVGVLGTFIAAVWTLYLFLLKGSFETSLGMSLSVETQQGDAQSVVSLQIELSNIGGRRITAPRELSAGQINDYEDSVLYPCDLEIRTLDGTTSTSRFVGWWSRRDSLLSPIPGIPKHISVLYEYTRADQRVDFFMEPGEKYVLGHIFILPPGHYAAKLVFIGERATAAEYWSRIFYFYVPTQSNPRIAEVARKV